MLPQAPSTGGADDTVHYHSIRGICTASPSKWLGTQAKMVHDAFYAIDRARRGFPRPPCSRFPGCARLPDEMLELRMWTHHMRAKES